MLSFVIPFVVSIMFTLLTIIFSVLAFIFSPSNDKYSKFSSIVAICSAIVTLISLVSVKIPAPDIYLINNNKNELEIEIKSDDFFDTYYTIDNSNPKNGEKYNAPFVALAPVTVLSRNKFFIWWSEESERQYGVENLSYQIETQIKEEVNTETERLQEESEQADTNQSDSEIESQESEPQTSNSETSPDLDTEPTPQTPESSTPNEGLNASEGSALMTHINQYRAQSGIGELTWNPELEQIAQSIATSFATGNTPVGDMSYIVIGRQCNGAKDAQRAVSDWISGNDYIPSEADSLLNVGYTQIGGALYYLPNGNEYGYHYFWIVCMR